MNNNIKLNVDEQQDDIKHLKKEQWDKTCEDKVQEITAARIPMKKNKPVCVPGDQTFVMKIGMKKHIQKELPELWWNYCGKIFRHTKEVANHMYEGCELTCHTYTSRIRMGKKNKKKIDVEKEESITKKDMENKEIMSD